MDKITVLCATSEKKITMKTQMLPMFNVDIQTIFVPTHKNIIKFKHKKVLKYIQAECKHIVTDDVLLKKYQKGLCENSVLYFYPLECVDALTRGVNCERFAFYTKCKSDYLRTLLSIFGKASSYVTLYCHDVDFFNEMAEQLLEDCGILVRIKKYNSEEDVSERYLLEVNNGVVVKELDTQKVYSDVSLSFFHPFNLHSDTVMTEIFKILTKKGKSVNLFDMHKVKIVGEISK